jgi:hypothetical protein
VPDTGHLLPLESPQELARLIGEFADARVAGKLTQEQSKALVLDALDTLFNKRDYAAAEQYGRMATFSTALTSRPAATDCSTWSGRCRAR